MTYKISVTVDIHELDTTHIAARSSKLGLTAYGSTDREAIDNYTKLMTAVLNHKGSHEAVESYLERHGIGRRRWWWLDDTGGPDPDPRIVDRGARGKGAFLVVAA